MSFGHLNHAKGGEVAKTVGQNADVVEFLANGTITAGDTVALDFAGKTGESQSLYVIQGAINGAVIGVALESAVADGVVRCCIGGYVEAVKSSGVIAAGATVAAAASGAVADFAGTETDAPLGVALDAASGSLVTVYWFRKA